MCESLSLLLSHLWSHLFVKMTGRKWKKWVKRQSLYLHMKLDQNLNVIGKLCLQETTGIWRETVLTRLGKSDNTWLMMTVWSLCCYPTLFSAFSPHLRDLPDCQSLHSSVQETMRSSSSYKHYTDLAILEVVQNNILMVSIILRHFICLPIDGDF